jgi:copper homeostasis protein
MQPVVQYPRNNSHPDEASVTFRVTDFVFELLLSGQGTTAASADSLEVLRNLLDIMKDHNPHIEVLPGSGINSSTVGALCEALLPHGLREVHMSGGHWIDGASNWRRAGMGMDIGGTGEWGIWRTRESAVHAVREILDSFGDSTQA